MHYVLLLLVTFYCYRLCNLLYMLLSTKICYISCIEKLNTTTGR